MQIVSVEDIVESAPSFENGRCCAENLVETTRIDHRLAGTEVSVLNYSVDDILPEFAGYESPREGVKFQQEI
jgi:hypothetical protein